MPQSWKCRIFYTMYKIYRDSMLENIFKWNYLQLKIVNYASHVWYILNQLLGFVSFFNPNLNNSGQSHQIQFGSLRIK